MINKLSNTEIAKHEEALKFVASEEILKNNKVTKIDEIRIELRELMRYIEKQVMMPIITDFNDKITSTEDAEDIDVDFTVTVDDFKTLDQKALFYIKSHPEEELVYQIQNLKKPTKEAINKFKIEISNASNSVEEFNSLFGDDEDVISFIRKNVEANPSSINEFVNNEKAKGLNDEQITYVKELLTYIFQNGKFSRSDLLKEELNFGDLFDNITIQSLLNDLEAIL